MAVLSWQGHLEAQNHYLIKYFSTKRNDILITFYRLPCLICINWSRSCPKVTRHVCICVLNAVQKTDKGIVPHLGRSEVDKIDNAVISNH